MTTLRLKRYTYHATVTRTIELPEYAGSTLRGAFGHHLKRISCMTRQTDCTNCPLWKTCPYPAIFSPPAEHTDTNSLPPSYIIEAPKWGSPTLEAGETLIFKQTLFGAALKHLALIAFTWQQTLADKIARGAAELTNIHLDDGSPILKNDRLTEHDQNTHLPTLPDSDRARLTLHTPMRLQKNKRPLNAEDITAGLLLSHQIRRNQLIERTHHIGLPEHLTQTPVQYDDHAHIGEQNLHWQNWQRYSNRQGQYMKMGGLIGQIQLEGLTHHDQQHLQIGQWLHIGKETVFGLGQYQHSPQ